MNVSVRNIACVLLGLSTVGCGGEDQDASRSSAAPSRRTRDGSASKDSGSLIARAPESRRERPGAGPKSTGLGSDNKITGTLPWTTGRVTSPAPKQTEQTTRVWGKTMAAGGGTITVAVDNGPARSFRTDENTFIGRAGDKHFHPYPGGLEGIQPGVGVSVQYYAKNGQEYASWIAVGAQPFAQKEAPTTKGE